MPREQRATSTGKKMGWNSPAAYTSAWRVQIIGSGQGFMQVFKDEPAGLLFCECGGYKVKGARSNSCCCFHINAILNGQPKARIVAVSANTAQKLEQKQSQKPQTATHAPVTGRKIRLKQDE
jgi:hypothetical protein